MSAPANDTDAYVSHPYLADETIERRTYQETLADAAGSESSLVALPTGTGKTIVSLIITATRLHTHRGRAVFLAPTKPLVEQQAAFYTESLAIPDHEVCVFTGDVSPAAREAEWEKPRSVVFATPQVIQNDLVADRISLSSVVHLTFDECHRATGEYSYTYIAERYWKDAENPLVTGLSASPGTDKAEILSVAQNLGVTNVEVVTEDDPAMSQYLHDTTVTPQRVPLDDEIHEMRDLLYDVYADDLGYLKDVGALTSRDKYRTGFKELKRGMAKARKLDEADKYTALSVCAEAMKLDKTIEVLETQGVAALVSKLETLHADAEADDASKAVQRLVTKPDIERTYELACDYSNTHPKKTALIAALKDSIMDGEQALVFTQYRDTVTELVSYLNGFGPIDAHRFVGQNNDDGNGMTQSDQKTTLQEFRDGTHNVLVATSVAEEGLDIPQVGLVVFFEPVPSGIRSIQRRGRTGRADDGQVTVLIAKGTRDEGYWQAAKSRESTMESGLDTLAELSDDLTTALTSSQQSLASYDTSEDAQADRPDDADTQAAEAGSDTAETVTQPAPSDDAETVEIVADTREMSSSPPRIISLKDGFSVRQEQLAVGDFVLSDRVAAERKSAQDFADTLVDGDRSIFEQLSALVDNYDRPLLILEGSQDELYAARNIHENAIRGTLASLAVDFGVSILWTRDESETAALLTTVAKREQTSRDRQVSVHDKTTATTDAEQQEYVVSSLAGVGPVTAQSLLAELGSVHAVMTAAPDTLQDADGVGDKTATSIHEMVHLDYSPE